MDILLQTNSTDTYLALQAVERFSARSGFCAWLVVRVYGFAAQLSFCVEPEPFTAFIEALEEMDQTLAGTARLQPVFEEPYIELALDHTGGVRVSGDLPVYDMDRHRRLQFEFLTDQTVLAPFARSLRSCITMAAT